MRLDGDGEGIGVSEEDERKLRRRMIDFCDRVLNNSTEATEGELALLPRILKILLL